MDVAFSVTRLAMNVVASFRLPIIVVIKAVVVAFAILSSRSCAKVIAGAVVVATWGSCSTGMSKARSMTFTSWLNISFNRRGVHSFGPKNAPHVSSTRACRLEDGFGGFGDGSPFGSVKFSKDNALRAPNEFVSIISKDAGYCTASINGVVRRP